MGIMKNVLIGLSSPRIELILMEVKSANGLKSKVSYSPAMKIIDMLDGKQSSNRESNMVALAIILDLVY